MCCNSRLFGLCLLSLLLEGSAKRNIVRADHEDGNQHQSADDDDDDDGSVV